MISFKYVNTFKVTHLNVRLPFFPSCLARNVEGHVTCVQNQFAAIQHDYRKWRLEDAPEYARTLGIHEFDDRVEQFTLKILEDRKVKAEEFLSRLKEVDKNLLTKTELLNFDVLNYTLRSLVEGYKWRFYGPMNPVNYLEVLWLGAKGVAPEQPTTYADFFSYLTRLFGYSQQALNFMIRMRKAIEYRTTNHWVSMERALPIIETLIGESEVDCPMYGPLNETLDATNITNKEKERLRQTGVMAIAELRRNYRVLKQFIITEYKNASRKDYSVRSFKDGLEYYRACLKWHLTLSLSPEEVHQMGLSEVARIHAKMKEVMVRLGFNGTVKAFFNKLTSDPNFTPVSQEDVIQKYTSILRNRIWKKLPKYFKQFPDRQVEVQAKLSDGTGGSYFPGSPDGTRPGVFYVNAVRPTNNPTFTMPALALHEGDPGHHFQDIYTADSLIPDVQKNPDFQRKYSVPYNIPIFSSYLEGWALYAESLGEVHELDIYQDDFELMGRYSQEIFRACRLVIDTGLHYYNWTRERAVDYLLTYTAKSRDSATNDVDRYITWPGQACSYKIGELKIKELRKLAERRLGSSFDIREFHDVVLKNGPLPLEILETVVKEWLVEQDSLDKLLVDFFDWRLKYSRQFSSQISYTYNDQLDRFTMDDLDDQLVGARDFHERLRAIDRDSITDTAKRISYDVLENMLITFIDGYKWKYYGALNPIDFMSGLHADPESLRTDMPMDTEGDLINYVRRLELVPLQIEEMINLTRHSIDLGTQNHNVSINRIPGNIDKILVHKELQDSPFYLDAFHLVRDEVQRSYIESRLKHAVRQTIESLKRLKTFITHEYMPHSRTGLGISHLTNGTELYRAAIKFHTDLDLSPEDVHNRGRQEVDRISKQMRQAMTDLGYPLEWTIRQVYQNLTKDTRFLLKDGEETLNYFRDIIYNRIIPLIPNYFRNPPELPFQVLGSPTDGTAGEYFPGTADGSRPGTFLANVRRPADNPTFTMVSLSLHETIPGHHLASNYALKSQLPDFRKYMEWKLYSVPYFFPFYNAFVEGWALYCEYLGEEMGVYHDKYELLGRYSDEMKRAARLVIDTGIHYYNWSRQDAIDFMLQHTALSEQAAANQIDRYVTWPGQALGYKIGEMKIKDIRRKAEKQLGPLFDIRDFHATILRSGPVPLNILENIVDEWIWTVRRESTKLEPCIHFTSAGSRFTFSLVALYAISIVFAALICN